LHSPSPRDCNGELHPAVLEKGHDVDFLVATFRSGGSGFWGLIAGNVGEVS